MIKVCHMTNVHKPEDVRIFHKECCSLAKAGYDVYLVEQGDTYEKNGVHIVGIGEVSGGRWHRMTKVANQVYEKALAINADIYHLHDPELLQFALDLKKVGKKVIFDSHEDYVKQIVIKDYLPLHSSKLISFVYDIYQKYVLDQIDAVIFPTIAFNGVFPVKTDCVRKITVDNYPMMRELYDRYDSAIEKDSGSLCYIGTLDGSRAVVEIVKACYMAGGKLYLAGAFDSDDYKNSILSMPEAKNVEYLGVINRKKVLETMQKSQVGIATILNVGQYIEMSNLPTKAHECMALGLPVILTRQQYNEWFVDKYKVGLCVDPTNTKEFAGAIRYIFDHPDAAREMGENGRRAVKEKFNWDTQAEKLVGLYRELEKEIREHG